MLIKLIKLRIGPLSDISFDIWLKFLLKAAFYNIILSLHLQPFHLLIPSLNRINSMNRSRSYRLSFLLILISAISHIQAHPSRPSLLHHYNKHAHRFLTANVSLVGDTQVNTYTTADQSSPAVVPLVGSGGFVVTWQNNNQKGEGTGVFAQMFDSNQQAVGSEFQVNGQPVGSQANPDICGLTDGKFVIAYESLNGLYLKFYGPDGTIYQNDFSVLESPQSGPSQPALTVLLSTEKMVAAWQDGGQISARTFGNGAIYVDYAFTVSMNSIENVSPAVASFQDGSFIISWQASATDVAQNGFDIHATIFDGPGSVRINEFVVNAYTQGDQNNSKVATFTDNGFIIVWQSSGQNSQTSGIYFQRYNADGTARGSETQANTYTKNGQYSPSVTTLPDDSFIITWESKDQDGSGRGIYAQRYNKDGTKKGTEFRVNSYTNQDQRSVSVKPYLDKNYLFTWQSQGMDGSGNAIAATIFTDCDEPKYMLADSCVSVSPAHYYPSTVNYRLLCKLISSE